MGEKCELCKEKLGTTFLDKIVGTQIKVGTGEASKKVFVCPACQKEHKNNLKEKISG